MLQQALTETGEAESPLEEVTTPHAAGAKNLADWQARLLPLMEGMVVSLAVFFILASGAQLIYLHQRIGQAPQLNMSNLLPGPPAKTELTQPERLELLRLNALITLEANTLERRHHHANVGLMSRLWLHYLGFVTGMILVLVGATFILGKLQERFSTLRAKLGPAEGMLKSTSPGLVMVTLGTALMLATIIVHHEITVTDAPVYLREWSNATRVQPEPASQPPPLDPLKPGGR